ncbi:hypothetical protein J8F10_08790 [Gemmata sp. G18]|uniref:Probable sensor domain-containing protein n=1 Tax=Gemmata palustris TaxID=2822762 RepID=A0ABS5BNS6_9BACT|nr:hypothetical protein [Gemmata palustris]MBP3955375.1 hypothetical protein [Gemmata palustris]
MAKHNTVVRHLVGYDAPQIPNSMCGPDALAELLVHARKWRKEAFGEDGGAGDAAAKLTDDGLRKLISLTFYTSLLPEEGRYPRFKLVCRRGRSEQTVARFDPVSLSESQLHRLAPACTRPDCALLVTEGESGLFCDGVERVGGLAYSVQPGRIGVLAEGRAAELLVEVFGPGHFRATEVYPGYEYKAGKVRALTGFDAPPAAKSLVKAVQGRILKSLDKSDEERNSGISIDVQTAVLYVLARMLRAAVEARHGGAFVLLPPGVTKPESCKLRVLHRTTDLHLGRDLEEHCAACQDADGRRSSIATAEQSRAKLLTNADMVANFSMVDGCVVLGQDLRVFGFGAKIEVTSKAASDGLKFTNVESGEVFENHEFMKALGGTRHQSVARLCQAHPGVMVYTVSQDGDLKLFSSDAKHAYVYGPLDLPTIDGEVIVT